MAKPWATLGFDLHLEPAGPGLRRGLTGALREAVRTGRLAPGTRLPSSRTLAADLGIARNTVADAYADLVAEGWLTARQGSGTRVADRAVVPPADTAPRPRGPARPAYDLRPGTPDLASFPRAEWLKAARRALTAAPNDALGYGDPRGRPELRGALAGYLARARGVRADPERLLVCGGFAHGLTLLATVLRARGVHTVAVESYGLHVHRDLLAAAGLRTVPLPLDADGTDPDVPPGAGAVLLTPAHQFPLGMPLLPDRRAAVVDWARRTGGLVLEDDYDGEFRYDRQPVGALQGLDPDRVVHLGTASKSLAPGLRLAWMVLPPGLTDALTAARGGQDTSGALDQLTLAEFLSSGAYDRHVRSARLRYRRRRDALVAEVAARAPEVRVTGIAAGLHAVLRLPPGTEQPVLRAAAWQGLGLHGLAPFRHPDATTDPVDAVVVGYGTPPDHAWAGALEALCRALP
ncbi:MULTISPECIES: PLP-dependent aminotransferase family protein [Streptomyces]|uniref:MocR-like pyridoxine biosynthesis transcription factor PdxR n=1 Tax=Streptomyces TaxID=1883 RepID=UPI001CCFD97D|nr:MULTISPECIES: PLP-dependent aminotransferase family protein [Streptomyces]MBZ6137448.1 PLP-dependent aminotransferase family protein [Streptomyces olivaceus]MBZ6165649.1 PLP-dependent aminotransferase family protein [Streptomyces olivaceus]MCM8554454.1 PLP-dependent aminotransferase family protein [Streptomyces sp. STCH 565 A]